MAISFSVSSCIPPLKVVTARGQSDIQPHFSLIHRVSNAADWILGISLLAVGILGATGILSLSPAASFALIGTGATYTGFMILLMANKKRVQCIQNKFKNEGRL